jgi:hypothetical protein
LYVAGCSPCTCCSFHCTHAQGISERAIRHMTTSPSPLQPSRYAAGVLRFDFDSGLAPYPLGRPAAAWHAATCHVGAAAIARLMPPCGEICITADDDGEASRWTLFGGTGLPAASDRYSAKSEGSGQANGIMTSTQPTEESDGGTSGACAAAAAGLGCREGEGGRSSTTPLPSSPRKTASPAAAMGTAAALEKRRQSCRYTPLPRFVRAPEGADAAELTALNMDKSVALRQVGAPSQICSASLLGGCCTDRQAGRHGGGWLHGVTSSSWWLERRQAGRQSGPHSSARKSLYVLASASSAF